jgi:hypothetical protein
MKHFIQYVCKNSGENNPFWKGGISPYKNIPELREARKEVLTRNNGLCEICNKKLITRVHHKDFSKENHKQENLLGTCAKDHRTCHVYKKRAKTECLNPVFILKNVTNFGIKDTEMGKVSSQRVLKAYKVDVDW